ncbi:MAG: hypothetical protein Q8P59_09725 [Dehalococcoidia bacterium]|nr:hypothetical protein [Dehalococcoidia bacterium]
MSLFDSLFGSARPAPSKLEQLFALSTAYVTLNTKMGLESTHKAGICYKPVESSAYQDTQKEVEDLLQISAKATQSAITTAKDEYGFQWIVVEDSELEDLVNTIYMVSQTLQDGNFGDQLLAAVFRFINKDGESVFWIYSYKRGKFYPFVPQGTGTHRDNGAELHLRSVMEAELPIEPETERWYALWGTPL